MPEPVSVTEIRVPSPAAPAAVIVAPSVVESALTVATPLLPVLHVSGSSFVAGMRYALTVTESLGSTVSLRTTCEGIVRMLLSVLSAVVAPTMTVKLLETSPSVAVILTVPASFALSASLLPFSFTSRMLPSIPVHLTVPVVALPEALYGVAVISVQSALSCAR